MLQLLRQSFPKTFLRGLTQVEERQEGVDVFVQMNPNTRVFAFQFKAPKSQPTWPSCSNSSCHSNGRFKYSIQHQQHVALYKLASISPNTAFYVFPYYCCPHRLWNDCPRLLGQTWFLPIDNMTPQRVFGTHKSKTVTCQNSVASINPEFEMVQRDELLEIIREGGIAVERFIEWYEFFQGLRNEEGRMNPWLTRGLRLGIAPPEN